MKFTSTALLGVVLIEIEPIHDGRGHFARTWCLEEFKRFGLTTDIAQCSISHNLRAGTLRGMHYQLAPYEESKLVRCTRGSIYDVVVDLRPSSPTFLTWCAWELTANNGKMVFVPPGLAHGFQTLEDFTDVSYQISVPYKPASARGVRWDDPAFAIKWPLPNPILSDRDMSFPDFVAAADALRGCAGQ